MPCSDSRGCGNPYSQNDMDVIIDRLDEVTQNLCWLCGWSELGVNVEFKQALQSNGRLTRWWNEHQESDTARVRSEMKARAHRYSSCDATTMADYFVHAALKVHPVSQFHRKWFLRLAQQECSNRNETLRALKHSKTVKEQALAKLSDEERKALGV